MILIKLAIGLAVLLFFALTMALISRINSLSEQISRILVKISKAEADEADLAGSTKKEGPALA
jgi:hypothetical protein